MANLTMEEIVSLPDGTLICRPWQEGDTPMSIAVGHTNLRQMIAGDPYLYPHKAISDWEIVTDSLHGLCVACLL